MILISCIVRITGKREGCILKASNGVGAAIFIGPFSCRFLLRQGPVSRGSLEAAAGATPAAAFFPVWEKAKVRQFILPNTPRVGYNFRLF
jgi:hypothetical protein